MSKFFDRFIRFSSCRKIFPKFIKGAHYLKSGKGDKERRNKAC